MIIQHSYSIPQFQNFMLSQLLLSCRTISKFYQPTNWNIFGLVIPLNFFFEIGRNSVSIIITIISNATVWVSHNGICFGYFMPTSHGVNKKATPIFSPTLLPYQVFTRFACCFVRNSLSIFFCSDQIITKNNTHKAKQFFSFYQHWKPENIWDSREFNFANYPRVPN